MASDLLSARLRKATADLHRQAERSGIVRDLLTGRADRGAFACLLRNLLPVYQALEAGLEQHRGEALFAGIARPELYRTASLNHDLAQLGGTPRLLPEGEAYAQSAGRAAAGEGAELIAFAYVRYIGDLSGGQILSRLMGQSLGLTPLAFYQFSAIPDPDGFRDAYRRAIDQAGRQLDVASKVVAAAEEAFRLDIALSVAVAQAGAG